MTELNSGETYLAWLQEKMGERFPDTKSVEGNRLQHVMRDHFLTKLVADGASALEAPCSHGVTLPTVHQDRYEYVILKSFVARMHRVAAAHRVSLPEHVSFGTLPTGHLDALTFAVPASNEFVVAYHSGLFSYLYLLAKIVGACVPSRDDPETKQVMFELNRSGIEASYKAKPEISSRFRDLTFGFLFNGDPWVMKPLKLAAPQGTMAYWLSQSAYGFAIAHEYAHIKNGDTTTDETVTPVAGDVAVTMRAEFSADFFAMQQTLAVMSELKAEPMMAYWGMELFFAGIDALERALAIFLSGRVPSQVANLRTTLFWRRRVLRAGLQLYLKDYGNSARGAIALADAALDLVRLLWEGCQEEVAARGRQGIPLAPSWRGAATRENRYLSAARIDEDVAEEELRALVYRAFDSSLAGSTSDRRVVHDLAAAVAITFLEDLSDERPEVADRALAALMTVDPDLDPEGIPYLRYELAQVAACNQWATDRSMAEVLGYTAARVKAWAISDGGSAIAMSGTGFHL